MIDARDQRGLTEAKARNETRNAIDRIAKSRVREVHVMGREGSRIYVYGREMMASRVLPNTYLESRTVVAAKLRAILDKRNAQLDERANYFVRGFLLGLLLGQVIGGRDSEALRELLPEISPEVREGIPFGHPDVFSPEVDAIQDGDVPLYDAGFDLWMGIKNDRYYYERNGGPFPKQSTFFWLGYLGGQLNSSRITLSEYDNARALLPAIDDDPTADLMPILQAKTSPER